MKLYFQLFIMLSISSISFADDLLSKDITVYKNPDCGCCVKWVDYLQSYDYKVNVINTRNVLSIKAKHNIPEKLAACHTAIIDGYIVEGHVTERDIRRLLLFRPNVKGIAVPGMPFGTPGMERGDTVEAYNVMSFDADGNIKVFVEH